jgi:hypothetical protein
VQVDQRKVVPFGAQPPNNTTPGAVGTVYGHGSGGPTALQYADPGTWVGADTDPNFDANDELVFMIGDAGGKPRSGEETEPSGVVPGSGVAVQIDDPQGTEEKPQRGWMYLFLRQAALDPSAGRDYVNYDFNLTSGPYLTTYKRAVGPNPETSFAATDFYRIDFSDRWYEDGWRVRAGAATEADILDGAKSQIVINSCVRSNKTFNEAEGAFVANIDGPVRAIRSYVGANSGPLTQRTHYFYKEREVVVTNLRVHAIPGIVDYIDHSSAASGMTYRSSTTTGGVTVDGVADPVSTATATWEAIHGPQGTVLTAGTTVTRGATVTASWFYRDQASPPEQQCWGDGSFLGASGPSLGPLPNTDPRTAGFADLTGTRINDFLPPISEGEVVNIAGQNLAADVAQPVTKTITPYTP